MSTGPIVAALLLTLGVAAAIAGVAWAAAASHRAAAEDALRDYAEFAAGNYADEAFKAIYTGSVAILSPVGAGGGSMDADHIFSPDTLRRAAVAARECRCLYDPAPRFFFSYAPATHVIRLTGDSLPTAAERVRLLDSLRANFDTLVAGLARPDAQRAQLYVSLDTTSGTGAMFIATFVRGVRGAPNMVYGFSTTFQAFARAVLPELMRGSRPLVPKTLTRGLPQDSLLMVVVRDASGRVMYRSAARWDTSYAATQPLWRFFPDGPRVQVAIRPAAATMLLRGGIPSSRLPLLAALLVCAGALVLIALQLVRRAEELGRLRADFTSSVSHELRTPLAQILLFAESLRYGRVPGAREREDALTIILREARRLAHLVDNVLLFSRTERRGTHVSAHPRLLAPLVREVVDSFEPLARARGASLRATLDPVVSAPVDAGALRQILLNLLDNAVKYGPEGQTVEVTLGRDGDRARIWVDDAGQGIRVVDYERIWDPFVRLESGEYSVATGSGIGLSVVHQLVSLHGGEVRVDRAPSGGARFEVLLPGAAHAPAPAVARPKGLAATH
ncbi:MAG TPA: HAMP domain-containing sensor histidine kinase [Gemmatimonadaceae bacterium]|nr:HAMP domain-containing sensor histidine kinase [Gemmatimonadaceae bacterium]